MTMETPIWVNLGAPKSCGLSTTEDEGIFLRRIDRGAVLGNAGALEVVLNGIASCHSDVWIL